jgi:hypothetical protein
MNNGSPQPDVKPDPLVQDILEEVKDVAKAAAQDPNSERPAGAAAQAIAEATPPVRFVNTVDFSQALKGLKAGHRATRRGWNGKGMWIAFISGIKLNTNAGEITMAPFIVMKTAPDARGNEAIVPWLASQTDLVAEDWDITG